MKYTTQRTLGAVLHILLGMLGVFVIILSLVAGSTWAKSVSGIFPLTCVLTLMAAGVAAGALLFVVCGNWFID